MRHLHYRTDLSRNELAQIYYKLNCYEWDERLGEKPPGFDTMTTTEKLPIIRPLMLELENLIPVYLIHRTWYLKKRRTGAGFDEWYSENIIEPKLRCWREEHPYHTVGYEAKKPPKQHEKHLKPSFRTVFPLCRLALFLIGLALLTLAKHFFLP